MLSGCKLVFVSLNYSFFNKLYLIVSVFLFQFVSFITVFTIAILIFIKPTPHSRTFCSNSTHLPQRRVPEINSIRTVWSNRTPSVLGTRQSERSVLMRWLVQSMLRYLVRGSMRLPVRDLVLLLLIHVPVRFLRPRSVWLLLLFVAGLGYVALRMYTTFKPQDQTMRRTTRH